MISTIENSYIFAKLDKNESLFEAIESIIKQYHINGGIILSGIGMLKDFEIGYFDGAKYIKEKHTINHELVSLHGSLTITAPTIHVHAALANAEHKIIGGHLFSGIVDPLVELVILKTQSLKFKRVYNDKTGLMEYAF